MSDEGIPAELREWVAEKRAILQAIDDPEQYEALRKQYEDELTAMLAAYEGHQMVMEVRADPVAILAGRSDAHEPLLRLAVDDTLVTIIRASG